MSKSSVSSCSSDQEIILSFAPFRTSDTSSIKTQCSSIPDFRDQTLETSGWTSSTEAHFYSSTHSAFPVQEEMARIKTTAREVGTSSSSQDRPEAEEHSSIPPLQGGPEVRVNSPAGSDESPQVEKKDADAEASKRRALLPSPSNVGCKEEWVKSLLKTKNQLVEHMRLGSHYEIVIPGPHVPITEAPKNCFGMYMSVIDYGVRLPLHSFISTLLHKYRIGISQLSPISWQHVLTFVATCELKGMTPTWGAFVHMHVLYKVSKSLPGWFYIANKTEFCTAVDKPNKLHNWRNEFLFVRCEDEKRAARLSRWNESPSFLGKVSPLPILSDEEWAVLDYFSKVSITYKGMKDMVPGKWLPRREYFYDDNFLVATGLVKRGNKGIILCFCSRGLFIRLLTLCGCFAGEALQTLSSAKRGEVSDMEARQALIEARKRSASTKRAETEVTDLSELANCFGSQRY